VWTAQPGTVLRGDSGAVTLPWSFMRLAVIQVDSTELVVRCLGCRGAPTGRVARSEIVHEVRTPAEAARLELADFALAVRAAALRGDIEALRPVMSRDFVYSLDLASGVLETIAVWRGRRASDLQRLPSLLDRGIAAVPGSAGVWAAPPEFATTRGYNDLRAGFKRGPAGWELIFLVKPELTGPAPPGH
jgi:hypothetical protein